MKKYLDRYLTKATFFLGLALFMGGCSFFEQDQATDEEPIARVYDRYLYPSDLQGIQVSSLAPEDSARMVTEFVENWIRHNLMVEYAEDNLPPDQMDIEKQLQDYRESLIIYTYEKQYVEQHLDTAVAQSAIKDFYEKNVENFLLTDNIYQLRYIRLARNTPKMDSARIWFRSNRNEDEERLKDYAHQYAVQYSLNDSMWFSSMELLNFIPQGLILESDLLSKSRIEAEDENYLYLVRVNDFKIKETQAPLAYVEDQIRKIILNKKRLDLLKDFNNNIYKDAAGKKAFEIYTR